jgi:cobalt-zinc-cadmium efflux system protein
MGRPEARWRGWQRRAGTLDVESDKYQVGRTRSLQCDTPLVGSAQHEARASVGLSQQQRLGRLLALNASMIAALFVVGALSRSLGVLAAGGDYLADSTAILLGLLAIRLRDRHGNQRATTYVALVNAAILIVITAVVFVEATRRLLTHSPHVAGLPVLIVSAISASAMVAGAVILGPDASREDLHMRSVLLDTIADGLSSAAVAVVGAVIYLTRRFFWLDAAVAIIIGVVIAVAAGRLLHDVIRTLRK